MEVLLAILASFGAILVFGCLALCLLAPFGGREMVTVWHVQGTASDLEFRVRLCLLLQKMGLFSPKLVIADCGLNLDARKRAEILCRHQPSVDLIMSKDILTYFEM